MATAVFADQRFTVAFNGAGVPQDAVSMVEAAGGHVTAVVPEVGLMEITGSASLLAAVAARNDVVAANPSVDFLLPDTNATAVENIPEYDTTNAKGYNANQWDIKQVTKNGASFDLSTGSHSTVVGIIDTGVNQQHNALKANLLGGRNFTNSNPNDIEDQNGHGSHVAGSIAGRGYILGVGPDLGYRMYRVFGASGGASSARIAQAMVAAVNDHVDVISMSIGGFDAIAQVWWTDPDTGIRQRLGSDIADFLLYRRAVQYAAQHGVVVVVAAGNEATNIGNPTDVTAYLNSQYAQYGYTFTGASREVAGTTAGVVTVSATAPNLRLASYSNYGNPIDISAPGGDNLRYPAPGWYTDMCYSAYMNLGQGSPNWYTWMDGTSMATPKVAAVAALIIDQAKAKGQSLTPSQVVARLKGSAIDLGKPGSDPYYGFGFASAYNALNN